MPLNEVDTCRRYVVPKLQAAGWETEPHRINEQVTFTGGRIARVMLNAELVHGKRSRIIIPTVYREDYLLALRALTRQGNTDP